MMAICRREFRSYFNAMTGWVFCAALSVFIGIYFMAYNLYAGYPYFSASLEATLFLFMVLIPILTMRSMAEERRSRTDQLLLTAPVSVSGIVLGKYLAMLGVFAIPVAISALCPLIIHFNGTAFLAADYATLLAFFLFGAVEIGVGLLISSLTESQVIAAVGTFCVLLVIYLWDGLLTYLPTTALGSLLGLLALLILLCMLVENISKNWLITGGVFAIGAGALIGFYIKNSARFQSLLPDLLGTFSPIAAFTSFSSDHVLDWSTILLYLSLIGLTLFLTVQTIQRRRWN